MRRLVDTYGYYKWLFSQKFFLQKSSLISTLIKTFPYKFTKLVLWCFVEHSHVSINKHIPLLVSTLQTLDLNYYHPGLVGCGGYKLTTFILQNCSNLRTRARNLVMFFRFAERRYLASEVLYQSFELTSLT